MELLQIVLTVCVIGIFIFSIGLINLVLKRFRKVYRKKSVRCRYKKISFLTLMYFFC